ncbi:DUF1707 domain-containing protein [Dactylosporangium salmoneum]|uniref:DUF1707 SHOCT-like domain-containing protein n=1 Tax=Dactylosporangium salmoneum TaxID=53361 RepID=UPI0031DF69E4
MRASDEDRRRVITVLQRHTEAGRLTLDEFSERAGTVYSAKTMDELRGAIADLPALAPSAPAPLPPESHDGRQLLLTFALAIGALIVIGVVYTLIK